MARSPRRTFATPFVVTLAACGPGQHTSNPPGPAQPASPATTASTGDPSAAASPTDPTTPAVGTALPLEAQAKPDPPIHRNPPPPKPKAEPAVYEQHWY